VEAGFVVVEFVVDFVVGFVVVVDFVSCLVVVGLAGVLSLADSVSEAADTTSMDEILNGDKSTVKASEDKTIVAHSVSETSFFK